MNGTPRRKPRKRGGSPSGVKQAAHVADCEDEEDDGVLLWIRSELARSKGRMSTIEAPMVPMKLAKHRADREKGQVYTGRGDQVTREVDAARDGEKSEQQDDERDVFLGGVSGVLQAQVPEAHSPGRRRWGLRERAATMALLRLCSNQWAAARGKDGYRQEHAGRKVPIVQYPSCWPTRRLALSLHWSPVRSSDATRRELERLKSRRRTVPHRLARTAGFC